MSEAAPEATRGAAPEAAPGAAPEAAPEAARGAAPGAGEALFRRDGERFLPGPSAASPWGTTVLHGGPVAGLLAYALERFHRHSGADPALRPARLTIDLFRAVPAAALTVAVEPRRSGRRIVAWDLSLRDAQQEVARATALLLLPTDLPATGSRPPKPAGPEGIATTGLHPDAAAAEAERAARELPNFAHGFHRTVEARWVQRDAEIGPPTVWLRVPLPVVAGEPLTPLQTVAATADFGNALANIARRHVDTSGIGFINTDISLHLYREPVGEWICLRADRRVDEQGIGLVDVSHFDATGFLGRSAQARLANAPGAGAPATGGGSSGR